MRRVSILTPCFRGEPYLEGFFSAVLAQTALDMVEVILVHNEPSPQELAIVERVMEGHPGLVNHMVIPAGWDATQAVDSGARAAESVSRSMNRGVAAASGEYIALWNVDDVRTPDSIAAQVSVMDAHPEALMTYGDMLMVRRYGDTDGEMVASPEFERRAFMRGCYGAFQMWRRDSLEAVGPFDEQLRSGADFDLWMRFAANGELIRTPGLLGYYLNAGRGLSTSGDGLQPTERTVVELRYGIFDKVDRRYLTAASRYRIGELRYGDEWIPVAHYAPGLDEMLLRASADERLLPRQGTFERIVGRTRNVLRRVRSTMRPGAGRS